MLRWLLKKIKIQECKMGFYDVHFDSEAKSSMIIVEVIY